MAHNIVLTADTVDSHDVILTTTYGPALVAYISAQKAARHVEGGFNDEQMAKHFIELDDNIHKCSVCTELPRRPVSIMVCGHIACEEHLKVWIVTDQSAPLGLSKCPKCRVDFASSDVLPFTKWPVLLQRFWERQQVKCECGYQLDPQAMVQHEMDACKKRTVGCPGCWFTGSIQSVIEHAQQCPILLVHCKDCGYPIRHAKRQLHVCATVLNHVRETGEAPIDRGHPGSISQASASIDELLPGGGDLTLADVAQHERVRRQVRNHQSATRPARRNIFTRL